ncbi:MAG: DUF669 domain-containing protein [Proteobacteria bacterium]|nr:DUF669 domain-containing protein [Pseudomonadota bacterium]
MYGQDYDFGVTLSEIQDIEPFTPIPPGEYNVQATEVTLKSTKLGDGKYLQFEFVVTSGAFTNRKVFQNVIFQHVNEEARRIGLQWLKSWIMACHGMGTERLTMSLITRYLSQHCLAVIAVEKGKDGYGDKNKIQRFKKAMDKSVSDDDTPFF